MFCLSLHTKIISLAIIILLISSCNKPVPSHESLVTLDSLLAIVNDTVGDDPDYALTTLIASEKYIQDSIDYWRVRSSYSSYYLIIGQLDNTIDISRQTIRFAYTLQDNHEQENFLSISFNALGICYSQLNNLDSAKLYLEKSLQYTREPMKRIDVLINLADVNVWKGNYAGGTGLYLQALSLSDSLNIPDSDNYPLYGGLGQAYLTGMRNFEKADFYFKKAEAYLSNQNNYEKIIFYNNRGNYYYFKKEYRKALSCFLKAKNLIKTNNASSLLALINANLGDIYFRLNLSDSAKSCLNDSYRLNVQAGDSTSLFYIATIQAAMALKEGKTMQAKQILQRHPEKKEFRADILTIRYDLLADMYAQNEDYKRAYYYQNMLRRSNDSLRSERVKNAIAEIEMRYKQDTTLLKKEIQIKKNGEEVHALKTTNYVFIFIALIAIMSALLVYLLYKQRQDSQRLRFYETTSKLRLQNIRNRISPHFMFNILNRQINQEENYEKSTPLYELVNLLRKSLQMTEDVTVTLHEEIDFVKSYLKLENEKSGHPLHVCWETDENTDLPFWKIPAMTIQIPVENALKYGIQNDVEGELTISLKQSGNSLHIEIRDNGPGYDPATIAGNKGTGTGLKVLLGTINILNKTNKNKIIFRIINLGETGSTGTAVQIIVPKDYDFGQ